ncbi:putative disease resistance RPP13-like protein 1 [Arachis hypogaea]|uniref:putative disease resistance RPP13-like protein 1 n=1 Tax=Arachis hypogaea TaxID=3818 RepID=UPI003B210041
MRGKKVDQKLLQRLKTILNVVEAVMNDAEKKQITDPAVKRWLEDLQDAVYDADDCHSKGSTRLDDIAKHKDILRLEKIAAKNMSGRIPSTSLVKKSDIFVGRDKERDTIVKLLLDDANDGDKLL